MKQSVGPRTIIFPTPALVVGMYDKDGKPNAMTAAWDVS
ncbi:MAG: Flavoredoxin [Syntrophus sp. SKADARSKE-3]|nr:Flavoredoxin [Syntrophus sp. SKADARSKE-3]